MPPLKGEVPPEGAEGFNRRGIQRKFYVIAVVTSPDPSVSFADSSPFRGAYMERRFENESL